MLSKPEHGWTDFSLGNNAYSLSYLTNVPLDWLEDAIHGLQTSRPFTVYGFCEPGRMLCTVSYENCHILFEDNKRTVLSGENMHYETAHISMLEFCKQLHTDISENPNEWCAFVCRNKDQNAQDKIRSKLQSKLNQLEKLIAAKEHYFDEDHCFI